MGLMYEHGRRTTREDGATTLLTCPCQVPATSVIDDIGADDEHATVVIIGGGPHALAALSALHDNSFAFHNQHGSYTKIGSGATTPLILCYRVHSLCDLSILRVISAFHPSRVQSV